MAQKIIFGGIAASGIVGVLFVMGVVLKLLNIESNLSGVAIGSAIALAIIFGILGIIGILSRYL